MLSLPAQETTSRHLCSLYPFQAGDGLGNDGVLLGLDALSGAPVGFDPFLAYGQGLVTNPNGLVVGQVGRGKSTFAKTFLAREARLYGRPVYVVDPKGEYLAFARHLGLSHLRLEPGGTVRLNPLDPGPGGEGGVGLALRRTQMLFALVASGLGRGLRPEERAVIAAVSKVVGEKATLSEVAAELLSPSEALAKGLATTASELKANCREAALELRRLVEADLSGMFDGPTTAELGSGGAGLVVDLSAVYNSPAQAPVMVCAGTWLQAALRARPRSILLLDEAWALCADLGVARWLQAMAKLARATGTSLWLVTHRLSDLLSAGAAGSEAERLAAGLLADTEVRVLFAQAEGELELARSLLGLSEPELCLLPRLGRGQALWRVGQRTAVVNHAVAPCEELLCDTDVAMREEASDTPGSPPDRSRSPGVLPLAGASPTPSTGHHDAWIGPNGRGRQRLAEAHRVGPIQRTRP